jgi:gamma-glutamyl phosphate reductase
MQRSRKILVKKIAKSYLPEIIAETAKNGVEVRGDEATCRIVQT